MNRKDDFCLSKSWKPLICFLKDRRKLPLGDCSSGFSPWPTSVRAHCPYQDTNSALSGHSSAISLHPDVPPSLRCLCCFILHRTRRSRAHGFSPILLGSLPTTRLPLLPLHFLDQHKRLFSGPGWLSCSCLLLVRSVVSESQWVLAVHSVLRASRWELTRCLPFPSCFLYNPKFRQADCAACHLLSRGLLSCLIFRLW
jgi:hypothetical protein